MIMIYFPSSISSLVSVTVSDAPPPLWDLWPFDTIFRPKSLNRLPFPGWRFRSWWKPIPWCLLSVEDAKQRPKTNLPHLTSFPMRQGMTELWPWAQTWKMWFFLWHSIRTIRSRNGEFGKEWELEWFVLGIWVHVESLASDLGTASSGGLLAGPALGFCTLSLCHSLSRAQGDPEFQCVCSHVSDCTVHRAGSAKKALAQPQPSTLYKRSAW